MLTWLKGLSAAKKIALGLSSSFIGLGVIGAATPPSSHDQSSTVSPPVIIEQIQGGHSQENTQADVIELKDEVATEAIEYTTITRNDSALQQGQQAVSVKGVNGLRTITYEVRYVNGIATNKSLKSNVVTTQPVSEIVSIGTKVELNCPNGTYVNTAGNTVCRPYESNGGVPAGASAKCRDGTYSFSQSRRGTCSHHGGVSVWY